MLDSLPDHEKHTVEIMAWNKEPQLVWLASTTEEAIETGKLMFCAPGAFKISIFQGFLTETEGAELLAEIDEGLE